MYPTAQEVDRLHGKELELKSLADKMVFAADVLRDILIETKGKKGALQSGQAVLVGKYTGESAGLLKDAEQALESVKREYAYQNGSGSSTENAYLRARSEYEYVIQIVNRMLDGEKIYAAEYKDINKQQVEHRKGDIQRLIRVFADKKDFKMIAKLAQVDFNLPLEPQLGFNPDDF